MWKFLINSYCFFSILRLSNILFIEQINLVLDIRIWVHNLWPWDEATCFWSSTCIFVNWHFHKILSTFSLILQVCEYREKNLVKFINILLRLPCFGKKKKNTTFYSRHEVTNSQWHLVDLLKFFIFYVVQNSNCAILYANHDLKVLRLPTPNFD